MIEGHTHILQKDNPGNCLQIHQLFSLRVHQRELHKAHGNRSPSTLGALGKINPIDQNPSLIKSIRGRRARC